MGLIFFAFFEKFFVPILTSGGYVGLSIATLLSQHHQVTAVDIVPALIQKKDADDLDFSSVFYFNFALCLILYAVMFVAAPFIAGLNDEIAKRKKVVERYRERLSGVDGIQLSAIQENVESNYAYFPVVFDGYGAALEYLIFKHDELRKTPILDQKGNRIMRDEFYLDGLNCEPYSFDAACQQLNREYQKNKNKNEIKSHHYIISFDPRDSTENCLTGKRAQELGLEYAKANFPGHQACPDGTGSGRLHDEFCPNHE